jgi:hypothetical protein
MTFCLSNPCMQIKAINQVGIVKPSRKTKSNLPMLILSSLDTNSNSLGIVGKHANFTMLIMPSRSRGSTSSLGMRIFLELFPWPIFA